MTINERVSPETLDKIIEAADEVITALAGTNEDVHKDDSTKMCQLWDDLNDRHATPEIVKAMARELQQYRAAAEPVAWQWFHLNQWHVTNDEERARELAWDGVKVVPLYAAPQVTSVPDEATETLQKICNIFRIGIQSQTQSVILANVENVVRFADQLHAIEREFFMVPGEPDEDYPDEEPADECLVNRWGSTVEQYVEQFRIALKTIAAPQLPQAAALEDFEAWARAEGLIQESYGLRSVNSATDVARNAWEASRAAMLAAPAVQAEQLFVNTEQVEPVTTNYTLPEWLQQAHKLAELHGTSFVVFRHGEEAQCADPTKVIISFTDEGLGHHSAAPQQDAQEVKK